MWISYDDSKNRRICIYAQIECSIFLKTATFGYDVFSGTNDGKCAADLTKLNTENKKNMENKYTTIMVNGHFSADCAIASYDMDYVLDVYITSVLEGTSNQNSDTLLSIPTEGPNGNF